MTLSPPPGIQTAEILGESIICSSFVDSAVLCLASLCHVRSGMVSRMCCCISAL